MCYWCFGPHLAPQCKLNDCCCFCRHSGYFAEVCKSKAQGRDKNSSGANYLTESPNYSEEEKEEEEGYAMFYLFRVNSEPYKLNVQLN